MKHAYITTVLFLNHVLYMHFLISALTTIKKLTKFFVLATNILSTSKDWFTIMLLCPPLRNVEVQAIRMHLWISAPSGWSQCVGREGAHAVPWFPHGYMVVLLLLMMITKKRCSFSWVSSPPMWASRSPGDVDAMSEESSFYPPTSGTMHPQLKVATCIVLYWMILC